MGISLKDVFFQLASRYTQENVLINDAWSGIETAYSAPSRHYHNLSHLSNMYSALSGAREFIHNWDAVLFSMYYHDMVYDVTRQDNELRSAFLAGETMKIMQIPRNIIVLTKQQILATTHKEREVYDMDTKYFVDADLCILGASWEFYQEYAGEVRKEYAIYPDAIYASGRKQVLESFLKKEQIFKTDHFYRQFEAAARKNIEKELNEILQGSQS